MILSIAASQGRTSAQILLRWHLQHGHIATPKRVRPERMEENLSVFDFNLSPDDMASVDALDKGEVGRIAPNPDVYEGI